MSIFVSDPTDAGDGTLVYGLPKIDFVGIKVGGRQQSWGRPCVRFSFRWRPKKLQAIEVVSGNDQRLVVTYAGFRRGELTEQHLAAFRGEGFARDVFGWYPILASPEMNSEASTRGAGRSKGVARVSAGSDQSWLPPR